VAYCTEAALDQVEESLHADSCIEKLDHLFEAKSGLLTRDGKFVDGLRYRRFLHCRSLDRGKIGLPSDTVCDSGHKCGEIEDSVADTPMIRE
jgi:hypothetical protein